jgi:alpha-D-xyloside xylohydrolase
MFGPSILVAPVYIYRARSREVYLPETYGWYDLYTGKYYTGGVTLNADAPYERMPLFVKEGSIIPVGPAIQFTDEKPADPVTLFVYTGRDCAFTLYEDEGTNYNYEQGMWSSIKFSFENNTGNLIIGERQGEFDGMLRSRTFNIVWITKDKPVAFDPEARCQASVNYTGSEITINKSK